MSYSVFYAVDADNQGRAGCLDYTYREPRGITYVRVAEDLPTPKDRTHTTAPQPFTCDTDLHCLEEIFTRWNGMSVADYMNESEKRLLRSLSVGDIVVLNGTPWICAPFGWNRLGATRQTADLEGTLRALSPFTDGGRRYGVVSITMLREWLDVGKRKNVPAPDVEAINQKGS
jgi:hypothetical protein